ncbi:MAG: hypothetical protein JNG88_12820 [Phycisphaerales bacterium]|nr:hypothetical protein [Phycisphaerales bacterium]
MTDAQQPTGGSQFDSVQLKNALKAFKKRLKMARLDDESRLGHGAMTTGGRSGIVAIQPPNQYPPAIWPELVRQGKLRSAGYGLYELAEERA